MDEFQENVDKLNILVDEVVALMPEDPTNELEAKMAELVARLAQHLEYMSETGDEEEDAELEVELEDDAAEVAAA
jgi:hypothetical protein